jgi:hypothetical protein
MNQSWTSKLVAACTAAILIMALLPACGDCGPTEETTACFDWEGSSKCPSKSDALDKFLAHQSENELGFSYEEVLEDGVKSGTQCCYLVQIRNDSNCGFTRAPGF